MAQFLIVYHSTTGGTEQLARACASGADEECDVALRRADTVSAEHVLSADGYVFAAPEYLAAISGVMKAFFDRTYYQLLGQLEGRAYAQIICAGSDGRNARVQMERIATGWRLKAVHDPLIVCTHAQTAEEILRPKIIEADDLDKAHQLGKALGAGLSMGVF